MSPANGRAAPGRPLLIIAGAGSGKTNTLAHRVAHLILCGADPRRILLLTFTRRAAEEMTRRVERICARHGAGTAGAVAWSGTFHAIASRLLRLYAEPIGLDPAFTVLDRSDAADLMDLVRDELGLQREDAALPQEGDLPRDLLVCSERPDRAGAAAPADVPLVQRVGGRVETAVSRLCPGQARAAGARLRRSAAVLGAHDGARSDRRGRRGPLRLRPGRRISGYQRASGGDPAAAQAGRARSHRGRRRRPGDLRLSRRHGAQHPRLPRAFRAARRGVAARAELSLDPADPGCRQCRHAAGPGGLHQEPALGAPRGAQAVPRYGAERGRAGGLCRAAGARESRGRPRAARAGGAVPHRPSQRPARAGARAAQHPVRQVRRAEVRRDRAREGSARVPAPGREPARPGGRLPGPAAAARHRPRHGAPGAGAAGGGQFRFRGAQCRAAARSERRAVAGAGRAPAHSGGVHHLGRPARTGARLLRSAARGAVRASRTPGSPIWTSSAGSPRPIRRASGFSPSSPSIRPQRRATRRACRCATRTI